MEKSLDSVPERSGMLVFDVKCRLLCSNYDGRVLYLGKGNSDPGQPSPDIAFDIKRLCFRLKRLADSIGTDGATFHTLNAPPIVVTSNDQRYRLEGSLLVDEITHQTCLLVKVKTEEIKKPGKPNFSHYRALYGLTTREIQILELLSKGASYKEISYSLGISFHTVRDHVKHIRFKLHTDGKCGILARLIEEGTAQEKELITESGNLDEPSDLTEPEFANSAVTLVESHGAIAGRTRRSGPTHASPAAGHQHGKAMTSIRTPRLRANGRITASRRSATSEE